MSVATARALLQPTLATHRPSSYSSCLCCSVPSAWNALPYGLGLTSSSLSFRCHPPVPSPDELSLSLHLNRVPVICHHSTQDFPSLLNQTPHLICTSHHGPCRQHQNFPEGRDCVSLTHSVSPKPALTHLCNEYGIFQSFCYLPLCTVTPPPRSPIPRTWGGHLSYPYLQNHSAEHQQKTRHCG